MSMTGLEAFDTTLQKSNVWLKQIMESQCWEDRNRAYHALLAVLHTLRDRLTVEEAVHFGAELPMLIRGMYYEGWDPSNKPIRMDRETFLARVADYFRNDPDVDPAAITRSIFALLEERISEGEIEDVKGSLPADLRDLWPSERKKLGVEPEREVRA